jgi:hypothetical protein
MEIHGKRFSIINFAFGHRWFCCSSCADYSLFFALYLFVDREIA